LENSKKDSKENIIYQKMLQYKNDELTSQSIIKVLKEQIKSLETEIKSLKNENSKKKNDDLFDMVEKMLKLEKEIDKYKNKNEKLEKELNNYKNGKNANEGNIVALNTQDNNELMNLKNLNKKYEADIEKYKQEISNLKSQIIQLKHFNKNNNCSTNKDIRFLNDSTNTNLDLEKYNKNLEQLVNAKKEIALLKSQIQKMENEKKKVKESLFRCKTDEDDDNFEEEFDMAQLEEGVKKKNRSEDLNIDFPGSNETKQKYEELEQRFNNLKEQVVPILKSNANKNITKNNASKICNLLGTSVNTTNYILDKYNK
jgi:chromosome segregation ATPase